MAMQVSGGAGVGVPEEGVGGPFPPSVEPLSSPEGGMSPRSVRLAEPSDGREGEELLERQQRAADGVGGTGGGSGSVMMEMQQMSESGAENESEYESGYSSPHVALNMAGVTQGQMDRARREEDPQQEDGCLDSAWQLSKRAVSLLGKAPYWTARGAYRWGDWSVKGAYRLGQWMLDDPRRATVAGCALAGGIATAAVVACSSSSSATSESGPYDPYPHGTARYGTHGDLYYKHFDGLDPNPPAIKQPIPTCDILGYAVRQAVEVAGKQIIEYCTGCEPGPLQCDWDDNSVMEQRSPNIHQNQNYYKQTQWHYPGKWNTCLGAEPREGNGRYNITPVEQPGRPGTVDHCNFDFIRV